jgi:cytochrome c2
MIKLSVALAVIGLTLLLASALPGSAAPILPSAVATSAPTAPAADEIAYGRALFSAKGCATCHHHAAVSGSGFGPESAIPDLTTYRWSAAYLRTWLQNPAAVKPATAMPNLELKSAEIEALIAFMSSKAS